MKYINKLNINFDQWDELNFNNLGWHNMEFVKNKTIDYYKNKYPIGTKVRLRKNSKYYKENTKDNPRNVIGKIVSYNFYYPIYSFNHIIQVEWLDYIINNYKISDLEYLNF